MFPCFPLWSKVRIRLRTDQRSTSVNSFRRNATLPYRHVENPVLECVCSSCYNSHNNARFRIALCIAGEPRCPVTSLSARPIHTDPVVKFFPLYRGKPEVVVCEIAITCRKSYTNASLTFPSFQSGHRRCPCAICTPKLMPPRVPLFVRSCPSSVVCVSKGEQLEETLVHLTRIKLIMLRRVRI